MDPISIGELTVHKILEMESGLPMGMVLPGVTDADLARMKDWYWDDTLSLDPEQASFTLSVHSYLFRFNGKTILIDSCNGNHKDRSIPFAHRLSTPWLDRLRALGVEPGDVDIVMCTHLHADHVGWNTQLKDGQWVPTFPNARYVFGQRDLEHFSTQEHEAFHREAYLDSVLPVVDAGLADVVAEDAAILGSVGNGVWLSPAFGHSPGCCTIHASDGGSKAVFSGDVVHHPIQMIRPDLPFFADWQPDMAVATRQRVLAEIADSDTLLLPAHFRGCSAGHVLSDGDAFRFRFADERD